MAALMRQTVAQLSSLSLGGVCCRRFVTQSGPRGFRATAALGSEPMKKRKKVDVNIVFQKEAKKRRKLEKAIRRLELKTRIPKPIDEIEGDRRMLKTIEIRHRVAPVLSFEETEERALLLKQWSHYKFKQQAAETAAIYRALNSQQKALDELRAESEELYQAAIQVDPNLVPFERSGPVRTPPIDGYEVPDGEYTDTTKVFDK